MRLKALLAATTAGLVLTATALATVTVYRNDFGSPARALEFHKLGGGRCAKSGRGGQMTVVVGAATEACSFRSQVIGRNLQVVVSTGISQRTPRRLRTSVATGVALRSGDDGSYGLAVYQGRKSWYLTRTTASGPATLERGRLNSIRSIGRLNRLSLRAFGPRIVASINGKVVATYDDSSPGDVSGQDAALILASGRSAKDAVASFDSVVIQVPDPK
jgi:hypothetical protein